MMNYVDIFNAYFFSFIERGQVGSTETSVHLFFSV